MCLVCMNLYMYIDTSRRTSTAVSHCVCVFVRIYICKHFQVLMHEKMMRIVLLATKMLRALNIKEFCSFVHTKYPVKNICTLDNRNLKLSYS